MPAATTTEASRPACAHCGLPVRSQSSGGIVFCCHACRLVAGIVGAQDEGAHAWNLLRLSFGALLAMNIMMLSLLLYGNAVEPENIPLFRWVMLLLAGPALVILLSPMMVMAVRQCLQKKPGLELLIAGGSATAFVVSALNTLSGSGEVFFDTATMLPVLVTFGKIIEATAKKKASELLHALESLLPATALRVVNGKQEEVPLKQLRAGDLVRILPGGRIPVDGVISEGTTTVEEAAFTGEPLPRVCNAGDRVIAGTINGAGSLLVETEQAGEKVLLQRIIAMIQEAWQYPSPTERIAERAARYFIPITAAIAVVPLVFWIFSGDPARGCISALSVLVVACPCTMGIATPLATSLAIARAATAGIVVRTGEAMEQLGRVGLIFFDKTGTLTTGGILNRVVVYDEHTDENQLLALVATLETAAEHPVGRAIVAEAAKRELQTGSVSGVEIFPGQGIVGLVRLGDRSLWIRAGSPAFTTPHPPDTCCSGDCRTINVMWDGEIRGRLLLGERIREDAVSAVAALHGQEVAVMLLSGDRVEAVAGIAEKIGIHAVEGAKDPVGKLKMIKNSIAAGRCVAMVGDGINDAAALAAAPIGIAVGSGTELARRAGNIILMSDRLMQIPWLIALSRHTRRIINLNFAWSFGYNAIALGAAAAGLLHPLIAALAMVFSSLTVLTNSLRINRFPLENS
jgi:heavy metal translocating P-type ATPase